MTKKKATPEVLPEEELMPEEPDDMEEFDDLEEEPEEPEFEPVNILELLEQLDKDVVVKIGAVNGSSFFYINDVKRTLLDVEAITASPKDMELFYSPEEQAEYGVVGFRLDLLPQGKAAQG